MSGTSTIPAIGACRHCGLAAAFGGEYCCYGCELCAQIAAEGRAKKDELYAVITFSLLLSMIVMMLSLFLFAEDVYGAGDGAGLVWMRKAYRVASALLATPVVVMLGVPLARRAWAALREGKLSMDLLVAAGAAAAYALSIVAVIRQRGGVYFDSATSALVLTTLGRYLEASARARASRVIAPSLRLSSGPVLVGDRRVSPAEITPGMELTVGIEEVLPVDARVIMGPGGEGSVDVTLGVLTGAAAPVSKRIGDEVPAGAVPVSGPLRCVALREARASTLERLSELARSLRERPSRLQRMGDAFAAVLTPVVGVIALATLAVTALRGAPDQAIIAALAVVLAACPCTYGVATPLVLWLALKKALEHGACIRNAAALEELAAVRVVAFDKTGTLTDPDLAVLGADLADGAALSEVAALTLALEAGSRHPVARAIAAWGERIGAVAPAIADRRVVVGSGVIARDAEGRTVRLGSARWLVEQGVHVRGDDDAASVRVALARDGAVLARFRIGETARPEAAEAIAALRAHGIGALMLTGDSAAGAAEIAGPLAIEAHADLSPEDKLARLGALGEAGTKGAMVGDGLNDAPALAGVGTSFAMEGGTGLARGMASVTLLREDLRLVPWTLALARRAMQIGWQNLVASTVYNVVFLVLAATGTLRPVWAGISMLTSSLLTLASSLRVSAMPGPGEAEATARPTEEAPKGALAGEAV